MGEPHVFSPPDVGQLGPRSWLLLPALTADVSVLTSNPPKVAHPFVVILLGASPSSAPNCLPFWSNQSAKNNPSRPLLVKKRSTCPPPFDGSIVSLTVWKPALVPLCGSSEIQGGIGIGLHDKSIA